MEEGHVAYPRGPTALSPPPAARGLCSDGCQAVPGFFFFLLINLFFGSIEDHIE